MLSCGDIYNECNYAIGRMISAVRVVSRQQSKVFVRGHKNEKILYYFGINKVTSTKYFMESTWYLYMSR